MRWSERPPAVRSRLAWLELFHFDSRAPSVAVAHLVLVRLMRPFIVRRAVVVVLSVAICSCGKRVADREPQRSNETSRSAVETLLTGRWHYFSYDIVLSRDRRFEVIAEPGYPGDVHRPPTGTWRVSGHRLIQKYDEDGFEEWTIQSLTAGNLRMERSGSSLEFRRVGSFTEPNADALEARTQQELAADHGSVTLSSVRAAASATAGDAVSRLLIGRWGDQNNTVYTYNGDQTLTFANKQFPSSRYNNSGTWRVEGNRLVHILKNNETEVRILESITADKMVAKEGTITWELAHLTAVAANSGSLTELERAAEDQLGDARTSQQNIVESRPSPTPPLNIASTPTPSASAPERAAPVEGPTDAVIAEKLRFLGMGNKQYKRGAPLVSTGGEIPIGTTLYPVRLTELAAAGSAVSDLYFFHDEFGEWKCLWRQINRVF